MVKKIVTVAAIVLWLAAYVLLCAGCGRTFKAACNFGSAALRDGSNALAWSADQFNGEQPETD